MRFNLLLQALPVAGAGIAGVFLVTGVLIGAVAVLNRLTEERKKKQS